MRDGTCPVDLCDLMRRGLSAFPNDPDLTKIDEEIRMLQEEATPFATQRALDQTASAQVVVIQTASAQRPGRR